MSDAATDAAEAGLPVSDTPVTDTAVAASAIADTALAPSNEVPPVDPASNAGSLNPADGDATESDAPAIAPHGDSAKPPRKRVLLIEPDGQVRGSLADLSRTLDHVRVHAAHSVALGEEFMKGSRIEALLLSVTDGQEPMDLLARLRRGECRCAADIPVVVMAATCDAALAEQLKEFGVSRLLLQPFKLGDVAHTLEQLWAVEIKIPPQAPAPPPTPAQAGDVLAAESLVEAAQAMADGDGDADAKLSGAAAAETEVAASTAAAAVADPVAA